MRKVLSVLLALLLLTGAVLPTVAASVTYDDKAREVVFAPGSEYSLTDLFTEFKSVMPGDSLTQPITVRNDASKNVKVKIYMRSLGAHKESERFLSQLRLRVKKSTDNNMAYMFDAAADETAGLTDWVYLGTLYSGGEVNLDVILDVPTSLDNTYTRQIGYLDWEFRIKEFPVEDGDPVAPQTGDALGWLFQWLPLALLLLLFILLLWKKRERSAKNA